MTRRVLLVDDDIAEITAVKRALLRAGAQAHLATNATDAVAALAAARPALVIVASDCENGEGLQLARRLAAGEATRGIPLLLIGDPDPGEEVPARVVTRPVDPALLAEDLRAILDGAGAAPVAAPPPPPRPAVAAAPRRQAPAPVLVPPPPEPAPSPPPPPPPAEEEERRRTAEALRTRAEELRRAADQEVQERRGGAEVEARRALAAREAEDALERLADDTGFESPAATPTATPTATPSPTADLAPSPPGHPGQAFPLSPSGGEGDSPSPHSSRGTPNATATPTATPEPSAPDDESRRRAAARALREPDAAPALALEPPAPARPAAPFPAPPEAPPPSDVPLVLRLGSLDRTSAPRLLGQAARARLSGRLDFSASAPRSLYLEEGRLVGATSGAAGERVEEVALRLGLITREQHRQAAPACAGLPSRRAAVTLLERGLLKPEELTGLVRRRAEEVLFALFAEPGASWRHADGRVPPDERTALDRPLLALAVEGVRRRWQEGRVEQVLGGEATLLAPAPAPPSRQELALDPAGERVWELADGLRALEEIVSDSPLDPLSTRQVLAALVEVGALVFRIRAEPRVGGAAPGVIDAARLAEKLDQVRRADYFTILGLARTATPHEIRESAGRLLAELEEGRWSGSPEPGLAERLAEVRRVVREAGEVLADDELRAAYLAGLD